MKPAPPFDCTDCGKRIGNDRLHFFPPGEVGSGAVVCMRCRERRDPYWDHRFRTAANRKTAAVILGLWPR